MNSIFGDKRIGDKLALFGWSPNRKVDTSEFELAYKASGIYFCNEAQAILESLGGLVFELDDNLTEQDHGSYNVFRFIVCNGTAANVKTWSLRLNEAVFPVGEVDDVADLFFSRNGHWYLGYGNVWRIGKNIDEAFFNLLFPSLEVRPQVWP